MLKLARLQEALEAYTEALAREPVNSEANFNAAITRLCLGDYREGWKQYEHRWETKHFAGHRPNYPQPMWGGEDITGKRIVRTPSRAWATSSSSFAMRPWSRRVEPRSFSRCRGRSRR